MRILTNLLLCSVALMTAPALSVAAQANDFATRCAAPGVVKCVSFDTSADFTTGSGGGNGAWGARFGVIPQSSTSNYYVTRDTSIKADGASSMRFDIPAQHGADVGAWFTNFTDDLSFQVGEGDEVYIQWRERIDPNILNTTYYQSNGTGGLSTSKSGGNKLAVISAGDLATCSLGVGDSSKCPTTCWDFEVVVQNVNQSDMAQMYANCSGPYGYHPMYGHTTDFTAQNGVSGTGNGCVYPTYPRPPCVSLVGNEWLTFQVHIKVGHWDMWDSTIQMWMAREGQPSLLLVDCSPTASDKCNEPNDGVGDVNGWYLNTDHGNTYKIGKVWLVPYHTGRSGNAAQGPATSVWYDDLIISRTKIPDPNPGVRPNPPTNFSAQ